MFTAQMVSLKAWRAIFRIVARSGNQDGGARRVALFFHRISRADFGAKPV